MVASICVLRSKNFNFKSITNKHMKQAFHKFSILVLLFIFLLFPFFFFSYWRHMYPAIVMTMILQTVKA